MVKSVKAGTKKIITVEYFSIKADEKKFLIIDCTLNKKGANTIFAPFENIY
jgi:hypothetical protein|tara:strand:- start:198 stop:350 length:153 start_codon:yes stop_codon:yes gene_type:complete